MPGVALDAREDVTPHRFALRRGEEPRVGVEGRRRADVPRARVGREGRLYADPVLRRRVEGAIEDSELPFARLGFYPGPHQEQTCPPEAGFGRGGEQTLD